MSDKKNIIFATLVFILFFLLFPLNLSSNLSLQSSVSRNLLMDNKIVPENHIPYIYKNRAGYFSPDLNSSWSIDVKDGVTLLDEGYVNYSRSDIALVMKGFDGSDKFIISDDGYPFSIDNRFFIIGRDRKSLSEVREGKIAWTKLFNYIITSIDGNKTELALGFLNGSYGIYNSNGDLFYEYEPGGSRVSIIYSTVLSHDSRYLAVVSGLTPQRIILYERRGPEFKPVFSQNLKDEFRRSINLFITSDNRFLFIEGSDGFYIADIAERKLEFFEDNYRLKNVEYLEELGLYLVQTGAVNFNNIKLLTEDHRVVMEKKFNGEAVSVKVIDHSFYIVIDNSVVMMEIKE